MMVVVKHGMATKTKSLSALAEASNAPAAELGKLVALVHSWVCCPKGAVRQDIHEDVRYGANKRGVI
jgi:hypothetical protein